MNNNHKIKLFVKRVLGKPALMVVLMHFLLLSSAVAQSKSSRSFYIATDRDLYVVGESIMLMVFNPDYKTEHPNSKYIYCDLQGQDGRFYSGIKALLDKSNISLQMPVSKNLASGNYLIRVYTKEMKGKPQSYAIQSIRIVNPNRSELITNIEKGDYLVKMDSIPKTKLIKLNGLKSKYAKRSLLECQLQISEADIQLSTVSISVVPKQVAMCEYITVVKVGETSDFYNNGRGLLLQGQLINQSKTDVNRDLSGNRIYFSIRGAKDIFSCISDSGGYFQSYLPDKYGQQQIYISTETMLGDVQIKVENPFNNQTTFQLNKEFYLTKEELDLVLKMAQNNEVRKSFQKTVAMDTNQQIRRPFYNKADEVIVINDYIDLDDLSMYFTELPGNVHLHKRDGQYEMRIINFANMQLFQAPLIMVDYVVVNDLQQVLKMNPKDINRIEIVREYYQKGDANFGGIINFISNKNDFASYDFSNSSVSISYDFLTKQSLWQNAKPIDNKPDARTTLFWLTNIKTAENTIPLSFYTSDMSGEFVLIVQGLNAKGIPFYYSQEFIVE
jgi:hypothetical protein